MARAKLTAMLMLAGACTPAHARVLRVALLPPADRGDVVVMVKKLALRTGILADELTPEEMVDPEVFDARRYQAAVYTGYERYLYQVRRPGDAPAALMRFLGAGGTLIVAGGCWPFYRPCRWDGKRFVPYTGPLPRYKGPQDRWLQQQMRRLRQSPVGTFNRFLGLNIAGEGTVQFEKPPEDEKIVFVVTEAGRKLFPSLPARFPFPSEGDLRFRPASGRNLGAGVKYTAVATAIGSRGTHFGDAICVIKHTAGPLAGGQAIYIWGTLISGDFGARLIGDALRLAAQHARLADTAAAARVDELLARLQPLARRVNKISALPERLYFARRIETLRAQAASARLAAELGNSQRAGKILADATSAASLLERRIAAGEQ